MYSVVLSVTHTYQFTYCMVLEQDKTIAICTHKEGSTGTSRWLQCHSGNEGCTGFELAGTELDINTKRSLQLIVG